MEDGFQTLSGKELVKSKLSPYLSNTEESVISKGVRGAVRTSARVLENVLGGAGNLVGGAVNLANYATGGRTPTYEQVQEKLPVSLPTSNQIKPLTNYLSGGLSTSQTSGEESYDSFIDTMASLLTPIPTPSKIKAVPGAIKAGAKFLSKEGVKASAKAIAKPLARAAGITALGKAAEGTAESLGASPEVQFAAKIGTMGVASLFGGRAALTKKMSEAYDLSKIESQGKGIPSGDMIDSVNKIEKLVSENKDFPAKEFIKQRIDAIKALYKSDSGLLNEHGNPITKPEIPITDLVDLKKGINEFFTDPSIPHKAQRHLANVVRPISDELKKYAKKDPKFGQYYTPAEDIFTGLTKFSDASKFLNKHINLDNVKNLGLKTVLGGAGWYFGGAPGAIGAIGGLFGLREASKFKDFLKNSSEATKTYKKMFEYGARGAAQDSARELSKLDRLAEMQGFAFEPEEGFEKLSGNKVR